jgi:hypothetical protein
MPTENRRGFYRIYFPAEARPRLLLDAPGGGQPGAVHTVCEVLECSERGLRFATPARWAQPAVGAVVSGLLAFARGVDVRVAGTVTRVGAEDVALLLNRQGIPLGTILDEQRWLRASFGPAE